MSRFIKLYSTILNTSHISRIDIQKDKYIIYALSNASSGWFVFCAGLIYPNDPTYHVCAHKNPEGYKALSEWIERLDKIDVTKI